MEAEWSPAREPGRQQVWRQILRPIASRLDTSASELAQQAVARMRAELPAQFPDEQTVAENVISTEASIRHLAHIIEAGDDPRSLELPAPTLAMARIAVQRSSALADLMRLYRLAQEVLWQWMCARIAESARDTAELTAALELGTGWLFGYVDAALVRAERAYETEREAWLRGVAAARATAVDDILARRERDAQRASKRLRYNVNRHHIGVLVWFDTATAEPNPQRALEGAVAALAQTVSAESQLVHPVGSLVAAGWLSRNTTLGEQLPGDADLRAVMRPGVRIAFGEPGFGLDGFRRSHIEATHAHRVASLAAVRASALTRYRDVAVAALASADAERASAFTSRVLGPLAADDEATYRVATTLLVFLEENRSRSRAAKRLTVHPNTISYRVAQAESILGRSIDDNCLELTVALTLLPILPGLTPPGTDHL